MKKTSLFLLSALLLVSCSKNVISEPEIGVNQPSGKGGTAKTFAGEPLIGYATVNGNTTGGAGGSTVIVSNYTELKNACEGSATALIIHVSGTITGTGLIFVNSNKSIIGLQGSSLVGVSLAIYGKNNVIIQNMTIKNVLTYSAIKIKDGSHHVWVDHCDVSADRDHGWEYYDGLIDVTRQSSYVTVSWNKIHDNHIPMLIGSDDALTSDIGYLKTTVHHNYFYNVSERQPSVRFGYVHVFNNYILNSSGYGVGSTMDAVVRTDNNYFENANTPIRTNYNSSPGYVSGASTNFYDPTCGPNVITTAASTWTPASDYSYSAWLTSAAQAKTDVLAGAGPNFSASSPTITSQPSSQTVSVGANVTFSVTASGSPAPTYQWRKNGTNISGATSSTLTLPNVQTSSAGNYSVVVSNSAGSVTSNTAVLTVNSSSSPTYQAENATLSGGSVFESSNAGWNGTGYVNSSLSGGSMLFNNVDGLGGGTKTLTIRYANGIAAMTGQLIVNGGTPVNITTPTTGSWTTWTTMNVTVTLNNNTTNTIELRSNGQDLGNIDQITISSPSTPDTYQAENGTLAGGAVVESAFTGFNGSGYVNLPTSSGSVQINNVDGNGGGSKTISIRYSLLSGSRVAQLVVNGGTPINITASSTGSWSTWTTVNATITLNNNSTNTIKIQSNGQDWGLIDQIVVP
jgi:pectate lyase